MVNCWRYAGNRLRYCSYGRTATVWAPKKSLYQTDRRPINTGRLRWKGAVRKCSSIWWKPSSIARKLSGPTANIVDSPIAESIEYRPPTQSQKPNLLVVSMPNSETLAALVETATKCFATAFASPPSRASDQSRALWAFVIVSRVVKVFEETMNNVSAASRSCVASTKSVPSTFDTNRNVISRLL